MMEGDSYERAVTYFLEEFAGDVNFIKDCLDAEMAGLSKILQMVADQALGNAATVEQLKIFHASGHNFYHGNAAIDGRVLMFLYFNDVDTGVAAFIPGVNGGMEVARFQMMDGLVDPANN